MKKRIKSKKKSVKKVSKKKAKPARKIKLLKKMKTTKKAKTKLKIMNIKVTSPKRIELRTRAKKYAKGNMSAWLRHAGTRYKPARAEIIG